MDKSKLFVEKLMNSDTRDNSDGCNKDDVAATAKKERLQEFLALNDTVITTNVVTQPIKAQSRGKEVIEKKHESKTVQEAETEELLGSVTTYNCHGTRTSARVIQKMRQDQQTRPITPPPAERDIVRKEERSANQKTPSQVRANRPTWSNIERNHFFDALNEFGKDFEAIGNFVNSKLKRRCPATDISFKSKDQIRQHYYQTYHKICKYIRFSEEVRKPVQELYALINYGEMRRKLQFVTDKHFMKLRNLIYHGHISVRCKGKNIRIKTPSCKALRRLNQLDDSLEDIRLPTKIEVIISPANMEAFGRVQTIAQNPKCRTTVPLHKKLVNFIQTFQYKWRSMDVRIAEEAKNVISQESAATTTNATNSNITDLMVQDKEMCFLPKPGVTIHRPLLSITEYLSSVNICLTAYEERMGIRSKAEHLNPDRSSSTSANNAIVNLHSAISSAHISTASKRVRTESGSDKRSPEQLKKSKQMENSSDMLLSTVEDVESFHNGKNESSGDELNDEIQELLSDSNEINSIKENVTTSETQNATTVRSAVPADMSSTNCVTQLNTAAKSKRAITSKTSRSSFKPLLNDDVIQRIRTGWTSSSAGDITIGDLYVAFGNDSKLQLDYYWVDANDTNKSLSNNESQSANILKQNLITNAKHANSSIKLLSDEGSLQNSVLSSELSSKLKQLLLIANLSERMRRRPCTCDRTRDFNGRTFVGNKSFSNNGSSNTTTSESCNNIFRQPMIPIRRTSIDPVKQLTTLTRQKMSRQVLVQRLLLPSIGSANSSAQLTNNAAQISASTSDAPTAIPSDVEAATKSKGVPCDKSDKCDTQMAAATSTSNTVTELSTFNSFEEIPQTSKSLYQQEPKELVGKPDDETDAPPSGIRSVDSAFDESSNISFLNSLSPMHLLRETSSNSKWLEENINDFSLTSLLGHLDEINSNRDGMDNSSNLSVISESSVDYMHKFQEIKALLQSQEKD